MAQPNQEKHSVISTAEQQPYVTSEDEWIPPDGGWGWLCVACCFSTFGLLVGMSRSFGIIYNDVEVAFPEATHADISTIPSMVVTLTVGLGIFAGALSDAFTCRKVAFIGGLLSGIGISLNYFAMSVGYMIGCFLIAGVGAGLACNPSVIIVAKYFRKRRTQAVGFSLAGSAVGSMLQPLLLRLLVDTYGFRGALLIQGGYLFNVCAAALLYRDPVPKKKKRRQTSLEVQEAATSAIPSQISTLSAAFQPGVEGHYSAIPPRKPNACIRFFDKYLHVDLTLLCNPVFLIFFFSAMFLTISYPQTLFFIPPYARQLGYSPFDAGLLLTISGAGDLIGRLISGYMFDKSFISKPLGFLIATAIISASLILCSLSTSYGAISTFIFIYGYNAGSTFIVIPSILTEHHGAKKLSSSYGILRSGQGITAVLGSRLAGHMRDVTKSHKWSLLILGFISSLSFLIMLFIFPAKYFYRRRIKRFLLTQDL